MNTNVVSEAHGKEVDSSFIELCLCGEALYDTAILCGVETHMERRACGALFTGQIHH